MPAIDPFLYLHQVEPLHFNIGGHLSPLSVRDQMIRGHMVAQRLSEQQLIHAQARLLIVGAGMGGVVAAMRAAKLGISVDLFDKAKHAFSRHLLCTRWVDPTQYDWPLGHFQQHCIPWPNAPEMPIRWKCGNQASLLVGDWRTQLNNFLATLEGQRVNFVPKREYHKIVGVLPTGQLQVEWQDLDSDGKSIGSPQQSDYGAVVSAMGFGEERCFLDKSHSFRGYEFWAADPFESPNLGSTSGTKPRVVISGAGDGSLQDFLRIITSCKSANDIWRQLDLPPSLAAFIMRQMHEAEDQAARSQIWGCQPTHDHDVLQRLHQTHEALAAQALSEPGVAGRLERIVRRDVAEIRILFSCAHFSPGYALNRFLTLLLARHLIKDYGEILALGKRTVDVTCNHSIVSPPSAQQCHNENHEVTVWPHPHCCDPFPPAGFSPLPPLPSPGPAGQEVLVGDVIVMRHGINPPPLFTYSQAAVQLPRQLLPYHYPG